MENNKQQTAVDSLWDGLTCLFFFHDGIPVEAMEIYDQAKQMEKEQALGLADEAYEAGRLHEEFCNVFDDPKGRFINSIIK
jgi:hypothetical protein